MFRKTLIKLYNKCDRVEINDKSKIVVISDVHRGDGTYADSLIANRNIYYAALNYYYNQGFTLIENGDGDELWKNKYYIAIAYNYDCIFHVLNHFNSEGRLHMIYGNHDERKSRKEYINREIRRLECVDRSLGKDFIRLVKNIQFKEAVVLKYTPLNKDIFITHGHQVDFMNYEFCLVSRFLVRYVWRFLEGIAGFKAPTSPANNYLKGSKVDKKLEDWARENDKFIICGHTHNSRFPKVEEAAYFNDGCCVLPYSMSAIEIENGQISLIKWSIYVRKDSSLYIKRSIIEGPCNLGGYLIRTK